MARPKVLDGETKIVPVNLLDRQVRMLKAIARAKGASLSQVVREAVDRYIEEESTRLGIQITLGETLEARERKSARAILLQKKMAKLRREVGELGDQVGELEAYVNALERIKSKYVYDGGGWVGKDVLLKRCRERLNTLQKWLRSLENLCIKLEQMGYNVVKEAEKLVKLEEKIDALWERV